ncbi:Crp/Fnr family transcriptional regulator [Acetivibrio cellulolyticus]|uniref:Crp/Fnr family transcriptional regulator n=1 Tax=Acetivibrio cellulolyticus TaxID=35830 RepID=UPI0001E2D439|nr:cyclic nucleotide-binding domain-containing protein [Acetivibrio cellulolyticus]
MESTMNSQNLFEKYGVTYNTGDIIFFEGDYGEDFYVVYEGSVKVVKFVDGNMCTIRIMKKNELFGEFALYSENIRTATVMAISDVKLIKINNRNLYNIINTNTAFAAYFLNILSDRLEYSFELLNAMQMTSIYKKLYSYLYLVVYKNKEEVSISELPELIREPELEVQQIIDNWTRMGLITLRSGNIVSINDMVLRRVIASRP